MTIAFNAGRRTPRVRWSLTSSLLMLAWLVLAVYENLQVGWDAVVYQTVSQTVHLEPAIVTFNLCLNALGMISVAMLIRHVAPFASRWLILAGLGTIGAAAVPTDPPGIDTLQGTVHQVFATLAFGGLNVAFVTGAISMVADRSWGARGLRPLAHALLCNLAILHLFAVLVLARWSDHAWIEAIGIWERVPIFLNNLWLLATALWALRRSFEGATRRPARGPLG